MSEPTWNRIDDYITDKCVPADSWLASALRASTEAGLPDINVTPPQGRFLELLARIVGARRILEVGTLGGYSTLWLARGLAPGGSVVTLELDPHCATVARANFARAGLADRIELREGPALDSLAQLASENLPPFDLVFLDADKEHHADYFAWALRLARPGTVIVADNVVRDGRILDPDPDDPNLRGIRALFKLIATEPRVEATALQTVGTKGYDGFAIARVIA
jgi:predicted O-methyltransferase YrrM